MSEKLLDRCTLNEVWPNVTKKVSPQEYFKENRVLGVISGQRHGKKFNLTIYDTFLGVEEGQKGSLPFLVVAPPGKKGGGKRGALDGQALMEKLPETEKDLFDEVEVLLQAHAVSASADQDGAHWYDSRWFSNVAMAIMAAGALVVLYLVAVLIWAAIR